MTDLPSGSSWRVADFLAGPIEFSAIFALTQFYDQADDCGIAEEWSEVRERLPASAANALLGFTVGPPERLFDPGRCGSYFQTPSQVRASLTALKPLGVPELARFVMLLERCAAEGRGVYVGF